MTFSEQEVRYIADLANLRLTEDEKSRMARDMTSILTYIEKLNQLDTSDVEPMAQVLYEAEETATLRDDVPRATIPNAEALANAPTPGAGHFKIPKVIER